jgi:hypothetical protein
MHRTVSIRSSSIGLICLTSRSERGLSASADSINRTATVHRCSAPHSNSRAPTPGVTTARATGRGRSTTPGLTMQPAG